MTLHAMEINCQQGIPQFAAIETPEKWLSNLWRQPACERRLLKGVSHAGGSPIGSIGNSGGWNGSLQLLNNNGSLGQYCGAETRRVWATRLSCSSARAE